MEMKKHCRRKGEGLTWMEECLFYRKHYGSKVCMRHGQMDDGSNDPLYSSGGAVKKYRNKGDRKLGRAAQERDDDTQPASEVKGVKI